MLLKCCILLIFWTLFGLGLLIKKKFGLWLDLDWVLKIQEWIWIAKYDSPLISSSRNFFIMVRVHRKQKITNRENLIIVVLAHFQIIVDVIEQWCSRDRNLRDRDGDRDLVRISRRGRDFIKNSETKTRDFKICAFCRNFLKIISSSLLTWIFFKFLAFFRCVLVVFYPQIQQTKNS